MRTPMLMPAVGGDGFQIGHMAHLDTELSSTETLIYASVAGYYGW